MKKLELKNWPILLVSSEFEVKDNEGERLREIVDALRNDHGCDVVLARDFGDGKEILGNSADIGLVLIDWSSLSAKFSSANEASDSYDIFLKFANAKNKRLPIIVIADRYEIGDIKAKSLNYVNAYMWKTMDTVDFLAGTIKTHLRSYVESVYPKFFKTLVKYADEYKYAWHTPGHMGGDGFLRSPAGVAMHKFFGEAVFRADLSISVPELGSLLDHSGVTGEAEKQAAKVFGADMSYFVLNGTSNVNQIIWRSQVSPGDIAFVDRNCHKSLNYAMVITEAYPVYMLPRRNKLGIIGPVKLSEFEGKTIQKKLKANKLIPEESKSKKVKMSALTNSTYDGVCYDVRNIKEILQHSVENLHFDEAWYAYARFNPMYKGHFGMTDDDNAKNHPPIFCSHSTHKLLTAFSQASMLHIKNGTERKINHDLFNESYMMHGSTSPQYNMIASLDVATKMMGDGGEDLIYQIIFEAIQLRQTMVKVEEEIRHKNEDDWFFELWQPKTVKVDGKKVDFADVDPTYLASNQEPWIMSNEDCWHGFEDMEENYAMLDPIKLTFVCPGVNADGSLAEKGIPASIVTNYLISKGITCEKSDYYSFLLLNSLGTTKGKQGTLITELYNFKKLYDCNAPMSEVFPQMVENFPEAYGNMGLQDHCSQMHNYFKKVGILNMMQNAFQDIPTQMMKPADAYRAVVRGDVEYVELENILGRVPAVMVVPYPPGIPIIMGGELLNKESKAILDYLQAREKFENEIPGYESDIHGVERRRDGDKAYFKILCIKE